MMIDYHRLIQGRYEAERLPHEFSPEHTVPDFAFNILNSAGLLYSPVVDKDALENGVMKPIWPEQKPFAVCLTHDVDVVSQKSLRQSFRTAWYHLLHPNNLVTTVNHLGEFVLNIAQAFPFDDPLHCYERWLKCEEQVNARSTFFFWPGWDAISTHHVSDCRYNLDDRIVFDRQRCSVTEMIREIDRRGWEIGLHPSWYAYNDVDELKRQKAALEQALEHDVLSIRQHYLHYDIRVTPRVQTDAGFQYDSTLGFNNNIGFRFGTCCPWYLYDLKHEKDLPIIEIPLIIQDVALLNQKKGMSLDSHTALHYITQLTDEVQQVGGVLTLLWHPSRILLLGWWELYQKTLLFLQGENAWFAPVKTVGQWWKKNNTQYESVAYR